LRPFLRLELTADEAAFFFSSLAKTFLTLPSIAGSSSKSVSTSSSQSTSAMSEKEKEKQLLVAVWTRFLRAGAPICAHMYAKLLASETSKDEKKSS